MLSDVNQEFLLQEALNVTGLKFIKFLWGLLKLSYPSGDQSLTFNNNDRIKDINV